MSQKGEVSDGGRSGHTTWRYFTAGQMELRLAKRQDFSMPSSGLPQVRFLCGVTEVIRTDRWTVQVTGGQYLSRQQLPLQLAWAMSIHKSQVTIRCQGEQNRTEWAGYAEPRMASNLFYSCRNVGLHLPTSVSRKLLLQVCTTTPGLCGCHFKLNPGLPAC